MKNKYDWSKAPKWAKHAATHTNKKQYWFDLEPFAGIHGWTIDTLGKCKEMKSDVVYQGNWQDSLEERPK